MKRFNNVYRNELEEGADLGGADIDAGTVDDGAGVDEGTTDQPTNYFSESLPESWRNDLLSKAGYEEGEDFDKALKQLERVSDIGVFTKNYLAAQEKIRKGEISNGLPENPSEEQLADYRDAHGIPATAEDYQLSLDEGLVLGEADEEIMGGIYEIAHQANIPSETMSAMTNAMLLGRQAQEQARISQDGIDQQLTEKQLRDAWGGDLDTNVNMVRGLVNQLPESVKEQFEMARMPDGKAIFNSPEVMVAMAEWARKLNPAATVVPNSVNPMQTMNDEIKALEARMGDADWFKDEDAQKRYRDLLTARDSMAS